MWRDSELITRFPLTILDFFFPQGLYFFKIFWKISMSFSFSQFTIGLVLMGRWQLKRGQVAHQHFWEIIAVFGSGNSNQFILFSLRWVRTLIVWRVREVYILSHNAGNNQQCLNEWKYLFNFDNYMHEFRLKHSISSDHYKLPCYL